MAPRLCSEVQSAARRALRHREPVREQIFRSDRPGAARWLEREHVPLGEHLLVTLSDVTERNRAEAEAALIALALRTIAEGLCLVRADDEAIAWVSPRFEAMFGYRPGELKGHAFHELFEGSAPEANAATRSLLESLAAADEIPYEARSVRKDGAPFWARGQLLRVYHPELGAAFLAVHRDVTAERAKEGALREAQERFRLVVDSLRDCAIYDVSPDGRIASWNRGAEQLFGYGRDEIVGREAAALVPEDQRTDDARLLAKLAAGESICVHECLRLCKNGERVEVELSLSRVRDEGGRDYGVAVVARDIAERKRAERATLATLRDRELMLKEIHHRVKNNLQVVSSLLSLQARKSRDPEALQMFRESQSRVRSIALFHEKLYRSRDLGSVDAREYLRDLVEELARTFDVEGRVEHRVEAEALTLGVDVAVPLGLAVNELVSNSLKHAFGGRAAGRIEVLLRRSGERAALVVQDDGAGLPQGFDFAHSPSLGLQLVRSLAEQLGGTLSYASCAGARFELVFPLSSNL